MIKVISLFLPPPPIFHIGYYHLLFKLEYSPFPELALDFPASTLLFLNLECPICCPSLQPKIFYTFFKSSKNGISKKPAKKN